MATDVLITPSSGIIEFNNGVQGSLLGTLATMRVYDSLTTGNLSIQNSTTGANLSGVRFINRGVTGNIFEVYGTFGNLLTIDDDLNDSIFSVNGSAGLPVFDIYSNNTVFAGQYGQNDFVITGNSVGIGLSAPTAKLHVQGTNVTTNAQFCNSTLGSIFQRNNSSSSGARNAITLRNTNLGTASSVDLGIGIAFELGYGGTVGSTLGTRVPAGYITVNQETNADWTTVANRFTYMQFATLNAGAQGERMRIQSDGNVGIGTTTAATLLQIGSGTPTAANGGIQFGGDTSARLYRSGPGIITCSGTLAATFSGNLTGNVTGNVSGTAGGETFSTVTGRGASTATQITVSTSNGGSMYTGIKSGAGYSDGVSGATFKSITDHPTGGSYAFAAYYNGPSGPNSFYVAANGGAYFAQAVGIGVSGPLQALHINGNIILDGTTNGYTQSATRGIGYGSNSGGVSTNGFSGMDIESVTAGGNYSQNVRFWAHHYGQASGGTPRMFIKYDGNIGIANVAPIQKFHVSGNSVYGSFGANTYKTNLYLSYDAGADETWVRIYVPQDYNSANNGGTIKVRVLWAGEHATFAEHEEYQVSYKTYYPSPYLSLSNVICTNKTTDFGGGTYYTASSTPNVQLYSNADSYLYLKIKGYHATFNKTRFIEAEIFGRTVATPTIENIATGPASPTELTKTIQFSPQEGNIFATGCVGVGTANAARPLTVNGDGTNPCIRLLNSSFASSTNTALYTFRGWLPIDIGATKYYLQVFN